MIATDHWIDYWSVMWQVSGDWWPHQMYNFFMFTKISDYRYSAVAHNTPNSVLCVVAASLSAYQTFCSCNFSFSLRSLVADLYGLSCGGKVINISRFDCYKWIYFVEGSCGKRPYVRSLHLFSRPVTYFIKSPCIQLTPVSEENPCVVSISTIYHLHDDYIARSTMSSQIMVGCICRSLHMLGI